MLVPTPRWTFRTRNHFSRCDLKIETFFSMFFFRDEVHEVCMPTFRTLGLAPTGIVLQKRPPQLDHQSGHCNCKLVVLGRGLGYTTL